ncbi:hypothetical protein YC2023_102924 [Brassica napus]
MGERGRGIPKICRCGEAVDWYHTFKWTDVSMYEELEDLIDKVDNLEGASITLQKGVNTCEVEIETLTMKTRVCEVVVEKEIRECKMQLRSLKNMVVFALVMLFFFTFMY